MCGIFGVVRKSSQYGNVTASENARMKRVFRSLAKSSMARGTDSTGLFLARLPTSETHTTVNGRTSIKRGGAKLFVVKDKVQADEFIKSAKFGQVMDKLDDDTYAIIGHTRASSSAGPYDNANNHPHVAGHVVGIHNGNIRNWRELANRYNLSMRGGCDSEVIFRLIDKFMSEDHMTMQAAIQRAATVMTGSFACAVMSTHDTSKLYLFRSSSPIKLRHRRSGNYVMFASESRFIHAAYDECKLESSHENFYEMNEIMMPDRSGLVLDNNITPYGDWVEKARAFKLDT